MILLGAPLSIHKGNIREDENIRPIGLDGLCH